MILMIDNYDSFTYNLVQYITVLGEEVKVYRNNAITLDEIAELAPAAVILSPGPGKPPDAGISVALIQRFSGHIPILGVCLGHQCIGAAFGGKVIGAKELMHGKTSRVEHWQDPLFSGIRSPFTAIRYHSLVLDPELIPESLNIIAQTDNGEIMGLRHREHPTIGIQFHPESILTPCGKRILKNFLDSIR